jgi:N-terminal domain of anti-restriction factor ArdC
MRERETENGREQKRNEVDEIVKKGFENLVGEIKQGHTENYLEYLAFVSRFHKYSHTNQMLIFCQKPDATLVAGYRTWQEMGHQVRAGEKGIKIMAPIFRKHLEESELGEHISLQKLVGFKVVSIFDSSQLTEPAKAFWDFREKVPDDAEDKYQLVKRAVMSDAFAVVEQSMPRGKRGEATPDIIYLREGMDSVDRTNVLVHEWGHELLHFGPARSLVEDEFPKPIEECHAESVAYIVSHFLGIDSQFSRDYLLHYGNTAETLIKNMEVIQKTSHYMIQKIERFIE